MTKRQEKYLKPDFRGATPRDPGNAGRMVDIRDDSIWPEKDTGYRKLETGR